MKFTGWVCFMVFLCMVDPGLGLWAMLISLLLPGHTGREEAAPDGDGIHSVTQGSVTYYSDFAGRTLGRSVDQGNGIHVYFDDRGVELGSSHLGGNMGKFIVC